MQIKNDLKATEDELAEVRTALSEATAAVIAASEKSLVNIVGMRMLFYHPLP